MGEIDFGVPGKKFEKLEVGGWGTVFSLIGFFNCLKFLKKKKSGK